MAPTLIGSRALAHWFPELSQYIKPETDWDVISDQPIEGCEFHPAGFLNNKDIAEHYKSGVKLNSFNVLHPTGLAIIKRSHLWRDLSFDKHITHYHKYLKPYIDNLDPLVSRFLLEDRTKMTLKEFSKGHPSLKQTKEDFFDDAVVKKYDHDWLHELVAYYDEPLYKRLLVDPNLVWCDKDRWLSLSQEDKLRCVAEETNVIAIERFLVPSEWKTPQKLAYMKSLKKVCTTLTSGWFRDFAIDHYPEILSLFDSKRIDKVKWILETH